MGLILASQSKIRAKILQDAGYNFVIKKPNCDEEKLKVKFKKLQIKKLTMKLALAKAVSVEKNQTDIVIACDQILYFNKKNFDKPKTIQEVKNRIKELAKNTHYLVNGIAIISNKKKIVFTQTNKIKFHNVKEEAINNYVNIYKEQLCQSVAGVQIENEGIRFIKKYKGCIFGILGLPIIIIGNKLKKFK